MRAPQVAGSVQHILVISVVAGSFQQLLLVPQVVGSVSSDFLLVPQVVGSVPTVIASPTSGWECLNGYR